MTDAQVEARLFQQVGRNEPPARAPIPFGWVHLELRRAGVTLELLWHEYQTAIAGSGSGQNAYQYSQFCELYRAHKKKLSPVMRQTHRASENAFLDCKYSPWPVQTEGRHLDIPRAHEGLRPTRVRAADRRRSSPGVGSRFTLPEAERQPQDDPAPRVAEVPRAQPRGRRRAQRGRCLRSDRRTRQDRAIPPRASP